MSDVGGTLREFGPDLVATSGQHVKKVVTQGGRRIQDDFKVLDKPAALQGIVQAPAVDGLDGDIHIQGAKPGVFIRVNRYVFSLSSTSS